MRRPWKQGSAIAVSFAASAIGLVAAGAGPYAKSGEIHIGGRAQFDYLTVDPGKRLYVSNGAQIVVIDVTSKKVVGKIADTPGVHGIAIVPGGRGFTSNGREGKASIVDLTTLQTIKKVNVGGGPDAIMYEPKMKEVYVMNRDAGTITVVKSDTGDPVTTITLSSDGVEAAVADPALGRVFVNLEGNSSIDAIDVATHKVVATWPVTPASAPTGLAIDTTLHRLFSGGDHYTVMLDATTGKVVAKMPICLGTDATEFDPVTKYVFTSCGDGKIIVGHEDSPSSLRTVQSLDTVRGARTMALDTVTHTVYVVGQTFQALDVSGPTAGATESTPAGQGGAVPDSFKAIAFAMAK